MPPFVVAAFDDRAAAGALERLRSAALPTRDANLHHATAPVDSASLKVDEVATGGLFGDASHLLNELFGPRPDEKDAVDDHERVKREATLLSVQVHIATRRTRSASC